MNVPPAATSRLLLNAQPLVIIPALAVTVGLTEAIFLQQLHYWIQLSGDPGHNIGVVHEERRWIYNTIPQWSLQFPFLSARTLQRAISHLIRDGLVIADTLARFPDIAKQTGHDPRNQITYYTIDYQRVASIAGDGGKSPTPPNEMHDAKCQIGTLEYVAPESCSTTNRHPIYRTETTTETTGQQHSCERSSESRTSTNAAASGRQLGNQRRHCGITVWTDGDLGLIKALVAADGEDAVTQQAAENLTRGIALGKDGMPLASGVAKALARKRADAAHKAAEADQHRRATAPIEDSTTAARKAEAQMAEYARLRS